MAEPKDAGQTPPLEPRVLDAKELFQGRTEIFIDYDGVRYRLRLTKKGRLLLQK